VVLNLAAVLSASGRDTAALAALRRLLPEDPRFARLLAQVGSR
jgi:hypothetical protein